MYKNHARTLELVAAAWLLLAAFFFVFFGMEMGLPLIAATLFSGTGAIIGLGVGALLVRFFSPRMRMWGLRLLGGVSLLPLLENVSYVRSIAAGELWWDTVATFMIVSLIVVFAAIAAGWILCTFFPPLLAVIPPAAVIAYEHLALRKVLLPAGFWPDNMSLIWLVFFEAGFTLFLLAAGWLVWEARNSGRLTRAVTPPLMRK